ncbi:MAG: hypothetical protein CMF96_01160 [Candidatus Marinimicrobia bacterium]|nr:hypothetical protein [Candidatus Neomarinimicrobiota bacterium]|tara:strand:+ start:3510 stop:4439 length:930 start_codon:yes stop_codon:yes gene_type:complete
MNFNQKDIFQKFNWLNEKNHRFIISADYDGLICSIFLNHFLNWKLEGYYDFENIWISKKGIEHKTNLIWVDLNILPSQGRAIGGHIVTIDDKIPKGFKTSCNPNILAGISAQNFQFKYPFSTILFLLWLHKIVIPDNNFKKSILLHADAVWLKMQRYPKNTKNWSKILSNFNWDYLIDFANSKIIEEIIDQKLYPKLITMGAVSGKSKLKSKQRNIQSKEYKFNPDWDEDIILSLLNLFAENFQWTPPEIPKIENCISGKRNKIPLPIVKKVTIPKILTENKIFSYAIPSPKVFNYTSFGTVRKSPINE